MSKETIICNHSKVCNLTERQCPHKRIHEVDLSDVRNQSCREMICRELEKPVCCESVVVEEVRVEQPQS